MPSIAVLGGGLAGRLTAWQLAQQGFQVALFERGSRAGEQSAAYIAAAMLAPLAEAVEATPLVVALGHQSLPLWRQVLARLPEPVFMQQNGSLVVWHAQDKPLAIQFEQHVCRGATANTAEQWHAAHIAANEPQLSGRFQQALFLAGEGQLDNRQTLLALARGLEQSGVTCHWHTETTPNELHQRFDWVIDCRGFGAKNAWNALERSKLRGVRGEVARVYAPEISLNRPVRLLHPRYPLYIAPKQNQIFVVGATQLESEDYSEVSVRSGLELLSALYAVHPAFGEAKILELASNLRPTLQHHNPEIRFHQQHQLIEVNGLFRHGFMIAPAVSAATVRLAVALLKQEPAPIQDSVSGLVYTDLAALSITPLSTPQAT